MKRRCSSVCRITFHLHPRYRYPGRRAAYWIATTCMDKSPASLHRLDDLFAISSWCAYPSSSFPNTFSTQPSPTHGGMLVPRYERVYRWGNETNAITVMHPIIKRHSRFVYRSTHRRAECHVKDLTGCGPCLGVSKYPRQGSQHRTYGLG